MAKSKKRKRAMPHFRVVCNDFEMEIEDEDGEIVETFNPREGEAIVFKRRLPTRMIRLVLRVMALQGSDEEDASAELEKTLEKLLPMLAKTIVRWDWSDPWADVEEGEELPFLPNPPTEDDLDDLDMSEIFYIVGKLFELLNAPKANS